MSEEFKKARALAYRYLSHRDRSARETADHLKKKGFEEAVVQKTLRDLKEASYLDDRRFAEHWARTRAENRYYGRFRLRQELIGKGLSKELIEETLDTLFETVKEIDLARAVVEKKTTLHAGPRRRQEKKPSHRTFATQRFFQRRHFQSSGLIPCPASSCKKLNSMF